MSLTETVTNRLSAAKRRFAEKGYAGVIIGVKIDALGALVLFSASIRMHSSDKDVTIGPFETIEAALDGLDSAVADLPIEPRIGGLSPHNHTYFGSLKTLDGLPPIKAFE